LDCVSIFYRNDFRYSHIKMPDFLFHRIFPPEFWQQADIMMSLASVMTLVIYGCLLVDRMLDRKVSMYLFVDAKTSTAEIVQNGKGILVVFNFPFSFSSIPFLTQTFFLLT